MADEWQLAKRKGKITGFYVRGVVILFAEGTKPTPCHVVDFEQRPERIIPPMFSLRWRRSGLCAEVETPYEYAEAFHIGAFHSEVRVFHADGEDTVSITQADSNTFARLLGATATAGAPPMIPTQTHPPEDWKPVWPPEHWPPPKRLFPPEHWPWPPKLLLPPEQWPTRWYPGENWPKATQPWEGATTLAVGEEDPGPTTLATGEEGFTKPLLEDPTGGGGPGGGGNPWGHF